LRPWSGRGIYRRHGPERRSCVRNATEGVPAKSLGGHQELPWTPGRLAEEGRGQPRPL